jgi:hypothetical protein
MSSNNSSPKTPSKQPTAKRSVSINSAKQQQHHHQHQQSSNINSLTSSPVSPKRITSSLISSFPFRYAFASDGCTSPKLTINQTNTTSSSIQGSRLNSATLFDTNKTTTTVSSSLSGRTESDVNFDSVKIARTNSSANSPSPAQIEINLNVNSRSINYDLLNKYTSLSVDNSKSKMFYLSDASNLDADADADVDADAEPDLNDFDQINNSIDKYRQEIGDIDEDKDKFDEIISSKNLTTTTNDFNNDFSLEQLDKSIRLSDEVSALKRYGVRRHHSAPQSDAKWLQVLVNLSYYLIIIYKLSNGQKLFL